MSEEESTSALRSLWRSAGERPSSLGVEELERRERALARRVRWRNLREYAALVLLTAVWLWIAVSASGTALVRAACILLIAGGAAIAIQLARRGGAEGAPPEATGAAHLAFLHRQLERQRDLLRDAWRWYLAPFVPGIVLFLVAVPLEAPVRTGVGLLWVASGLGAALVAVVFLAVARLNAAGARRLQAEIDLLEHETADAEERY